MRIVTVSWPCFRAFSASVAAFGPARTSFWLHAGQVSETIGGDLSGAKHTPHKSCWSQREFAPRFQKETGEC